MIVGGVVDVLEAPAGVGTVVSGLHFVRDDLVLESLVFGERVTALCGVGLVVGVTQGASVCGPCTTLHSAL